MTNEIKQKVFLVDVDNGETYEDYHHFIDKVFSTYRIASQWLLDKGYIPYHQYGYEDNDSLYFYWTESNKYMSKCCKAHIIEKEIEA